MSLVWATRGYTWGFRFVRAGGLKDPLALYERLFPLSNRDADVAWRVADRVAVRLADPEGRRDRSGRVIVHEFILDGDLAERVDGPAAALEIVWPLVADEFAAIWDGPDPPGDNADRTGPT